MPGELYGDTHLPHQGTLQDKISSGLFPNLWLTFKNPLIWSDPTAGITIIYKQEKLSNLAHRKELEVLKYQPINPWVF